MKLLLWLRAHPWKSIALVVAAFIVIELATIPWFSIATLARMNPAETSVMRQRMNEAADAGKKLRIQHLWVPLSSLPKYLTDAVVVAEDGTFYEHGGFDWYEVQESIERDLQERRFARGASTITQQLAKNLYLSTSKDPIRKVKEAVITLLLEHFLSKDRILELYLNNIEWGRGIFGIESAAQTYFHKSAADLTPDEAYRLAAVIPSPLRHRPDADSRYVLRRSAIVERRLEARRKGVPIIIEEEDTAEAPLDMTPDTVRAMDTTRTADTSAREGD